MTTLNEAEAIIRDLLQPGECHMIRAGECLEHGEFDGQTLDACPHSRARDFLENLEK